MICPLKSFLTKLVLLGFQDFEGFLLSFVLYFHLEFFWLINFLHIEIEIQYMSNIFTSMRSSAFSFSLNKIICLLFQNTQAFFVVNYFWMNLNYFFCQNSYLRLNFWQKKRDKIIGFLYVEPLNSKVNLYAEVKIYCKFVRGGNFYYKSVQRGKSLLVEIRTPNFGQLFISVQ